MKIVVQNHKDRSLMLLSARPGCRGAVSWRRMASRFGSDAMKLSESKLSFFGEARASLNHVRKVVRAAPIPTILPQDQSL
jgi:hypothetical protein